jgi:hypothetical protein
VHSLSYRYFFSSRWIISGAINTAVMSLGCQLLGSWPETGLEEMSNDLLEADFWTTSKCAIKCRTRSAVTQAEAAIAIATSLHR